MAATDGRYHEALDHVYRQIDHLRSVNDRRGKESGLNNLSLVNGMLGSYQWTLSCSARAITVHQEVGDRVGEAHAWDSHGSAYHRLGQHRLAIACYRQSLKLFDSCGLDGFHVADVLLHLGDAYLAAADPDAARRTWRRSLAIFENVGHAAAEEVRARLDHLQPTAEPSSNG